MLFDSRVVSALSGDREGLIFIFNYLQESDRSQHQDLAPERPNFALLACRKSRRTSNSASEAPTLFPGGQPLSALIVL
jgi:hypothetical protein